MIRQGPYFYHIVCLFRLREGGWSRARAGGQTVITALLPGAEHPVLAVLLAPVPSWCDLEEVALCV